MSESLSKLVDYVALAGGASLAKLVTSPILAPGAALAKQVSYPVLAPGISLAKQVSYAVLSLAAPASFGPIPIFPSLPEGFPVRISLVLDTTLGTVKSLREVRFANQALPLWDIEIPFYELRDQTQNEFPFLPFVGFQQYEELCQLWLMMYGQTGVFAFDCPWDDSRKDQLIGIGDGSTFEYVAVRTWGFGLTATTAPVGVINAITNVKLNGVVVSSDNYFFDRNKLFFADVEGNVYPPPNGEAITMTFSYFYLCRFVEDEQDFEEFSKNRWTVPSLKFRAVIWP